jgi:hypothetical protein
MKPADSSRPLSTTLQTQRACLRLVDLDPTACGPPQRVGMPNDRSPTIEQPQRDILFRMGLALLFLQTTEQLIRGCLTYVFPSGGILTLEMLERIENRKHTLGQFLVELRKRIDVDDQFDSILAEFLDKRNILIHRIGDVPGWSLDNDHGLKIARQFVDRLLIIDQQVRGVFTAVLVTWAREVNITTPVDHLFADTEAYRNIVNALFFERSEPHPGSDDASGTEEEFCTKTRPLQQLGFSDVEV